MDFNNIKNRCIFTVYGSEANIWETVWLGTTGCAARFNGRESVLLGQAGRELSGLPVYLTTAGGSTAPQLDWEKNVEGNEERRDRKKNQLDWKVFFFLFEEEDSFYFI